ncbi:MAG: hypothetical protein ABMA15_03860 [Vicinamibacterales bacterium]
MKKQNREVNIFNMSLLDILCGALGAFCFMMLALFPSYIKAKNATESGSGDVEQRAESAEQQARDAQQQARDAQQQAQEAQQQAQQARAEQSLAYFNLHWSTLDDVDLGVKTSDGTYITVKKAADPSKKESGTVRDVQKGPAIESVWFADVARPNAIFEMYGELAARAAPGAPDSGPPSFPFPNQSPSAATVVVDPYVVGRSFDKDGDAMMGLFPLNSVVLTTPRQRVLLGRLVFDAQGQDFTVEGPQAPPPTPGTGRTP